MKLNKAIFSICLMLFVAAPSWAQRGQGNRNGARNGGGNCLLLQSSAATQPLSAAEAQDLLLLREEEKLARDVYQVLFAKWGVLVFSNIGAAEQRHLDAVETLITRYGLTDPAQPTAGVFADAGLQRLYGDLVAKGSASLLDAMEVGLAIEEKDIEDLKVAMATTKNRDVLRVYNNLLNGSLNHLAAFTSHVESIRSR